MPVSDEDTENMPIVACVTVGLFEENCYLYACPETREAVIIDPGDEPEKILDYPGAQTCPQIYYKYAWTYRSYLCH